MKYFSMVGPVEDIDLAVNRYLTKYDIHYENAAKQMAINEGIQAFNIGNPFLETLNKAERFIRDKESFESAEPDTVSVEEAARLIDEAFLAMEQREDKIKALQTQRDGIRQYIEQFRGFSAMPIDLQGLDKFEYIACEFGRFTRQQYGKFEIMMGRHLDMTGGSDGYSSEVTELKSRLSAIEQYIASLYRFENLAVNLKEATELSHFNYVFGRLPVNNLNQFERFCIGDKDVVFLEASRDSTYVWGVYMTPVVAQDTVGSIFSSLHFEELSVSHIFIEESVNGTPKQIIAYWEQRKVKLNAQINKAYRNAQAEQSARHESTFDDSEILFLQGDEDNDYIYGVYFIPATVRNKVSAIFRSLHFERVALTNTFMGESVPGTPREILKHWRQKLDKLQAEIGALETGAFDAASAYNRRLSAAYAKIKKEHDIFEIKRYAAINKKTTYTFIGWMREEDAKVLEKEAIGSGVSVYLREDGDEPFDGEEPPITLKNPPVIRMFEFFTRMYGVPSYGEFDPTPVMAVVYSLLYGLMFGDVGQGACISLLGWFLYRFKKVALGGVMMVLGVSAAFFGFMYGSVFGLEEVIPAVWHHPQEDIMGTLLSAVGVGVGVIFTAMLLHIANSAKRRNWGEMFFSPNGLSGLAFYGMVLFTAVRVMLWGQPITAINIFLLVLPLLLVALKEPISKYIEGEKKLVEGNVVMYAMGLVLELVEVLLSYATNTISFIRVGAFAISHAGMMAVVLMLAKTANDTHNPIVMVIGNLLVIGIEGFLVGIQVLRLDFYELFSRFYNGGGQPFTPYKLGRQK